MKKSAFFILLKFCALSLLAVNLQAEFTDMQVVQTTKTKREKATKQVVFLEKIIDYDSFIFRVNAMVVAPCKLYGVKFYDAQKCIKDKKELDKFKKFYDKEIKNILRPHRNYYILTRKNLGDRWLCEVSDEKNILNKTLVKNELAAWAVKEYEKIKIKDSFVKKNYPDIYECLTGKKLENEKPKKAKKAEINATKNERNQKAAPLEQPQTQPPSDPAPQGNGPVNLKELGIEFGKDFGEK